ncbi:ras-responsive element-binding protein 1-like isoform X1 [Xenia sp. Carnegie-2017]|uniref:ras-responsive element-binding protein 1-like isoform X1 n=1 Tax=Xenia sp. Carnegie-2017 TaxID=2897299 RepID=UPI001F03F51E|nr:ras-responsive element-binding protein 1-like isoform X1 [Xenia sp. Carnegie-2017]
MTTILQRFKEGIVNGYKETGDELRNDIPASEGNCKQGQQFDTTDDELKSRDPEPNSPTRSPVENLSPEFLAESVEKSTNETKGERPFKCDVCGRGFKQSSDMKKHRKTHFKKQTSSKSGPEPSYVVQTENTTNVSDGNPNGTLDITI